VNSVYKVNMIHETPAERRRKAQESRILEAALELVGESGIDALSIKGIAERADYSPAALYRYFESKDELIAALALRVARVLGEELAGCAAPDPLFRVAELAGRFVAFAFEDEARFGLIHVLLADPRVLVDDAKLVGEVLAAVMEVLAPLAQAFDEAAQAEQLAPGSANDRALLLATSLLGILLLRKQAPRFPRALALESLSRELVTTLLKGFGAEEKALACIDWNRLEGLR
jgi:AcrR family transcriptional regulator